MLLFALVFPGVVIVAVVVLALARRGPFRRLAIDLAHSVSAASVNRRVRARNLLAIAVTVIVAASLTAACLLDIRNPSEVHAPLDGLVLFLLVPILTSIVAVAFFAFLPVFHETSGTRSAELAPRTPLSFGPRSAFVAPIAAAAALFGLVIVFGALADAGGRTVSYSYADGMGGGGGGFPGFSYGIPILIGIVLLAAVVVVALLRIVSASRPTDASLREADATMRLLAIRVVMNTAASALVLTGGFLLCMAGSTAASMARGSSWGLDGEPIARDATLQLIGTFGAVGLCVGIAFIIATVVFIVRAVSDAIRTPFEIVRIAEASA